jgi:hypothetical protein
MTAVSLMTLSIMTLGMTALSIMTLRQHWDEF